MSTKKGLIKALLFTLLPVIIFAQEGAYTSNLNVRRAMIALNIAENEPENQGESFPPEVKRLYCFTQINGATDSADIEHRWYWGDDLMASIPLKIKSSSWRTYSCKTIPAALSGEWRVAIVDINTDSVLKMLKFTIE